MNRDLVGPDQAQLSGNGSGLPAEARPQPSEKQGSLRSESGPRFRSLGDVDARDLRRERPEARVVEEPRAHLLPGCEAGPRQVGDSGSLVLSPAAGPRDDVSQAGAASRGLRRERCGFALESEGRERAVVGVHAAQPDDGGRDIGRAKARRRSSLQAPAEHAPRRGASHARSRPRARRRPLESRRQTSRLRGRRARRGRARPRWPAPGRPE